MCKITKRKTEHKRHSNFTPGYRQICLKLFHHFIKGKAESACYTKSFIILI